MSTEVDEYTRAVKKLPKFQELWPSQIEEFSKKHNLSQFQHPPIEELVHHNVSEGEIVAFNTDTKNTGYTLPSTSYEGPGNSVNRGLPHGHADTVAEKHDAQYFDAQYRYGQGDISRQIFEQEISDSDREAIREFNQGNTFGDDLGKDGLTIKHLTEKVTGQIYPSSGKRCQSIGKTLLTLKSKNMLNKTRVIHRSKLILKNQTLLGLQTSLPLKKRNL